MFLFFKPPQSYLQVQLLDPDGPKRKYNAFEEAYAAQLLKERQRKTKKKKKPSVEFKKLIEKQLEAGVSEDDLIQPIDIEALRAEVSAIISEYQARIAAEQELAAQRARLAEYLAREAEIERLALQEKKRKKKVKRLKILLLLSTLDN